MTHSGTIDGAERRPPPRESEERYDWTLDDLIGLFELPFADLLYRAQTVHRLYFPANRVQLSTLLSIKTGGCPEDCAYCPQSAHYEAGVEREPIWLLAEVLGAARRAKAAGASRFCMGAAWRAPTDDDLDRVIEMIAGVKALGLETCVTLGMLSPDQARRLKAAGLDFYNHNIDTSEAYYREIITTRRYQDRLETLAHLRDAGIRVCCGGIVGMGESRADRAAMLMTLATLPEHPESVPINMLMRVDGTPLAEAPLLDGFEFIRTVAAARIAMPRSVVRLSAGREGMSDELQALAFLAGANSIFVGERLLTTKNPSRDRDAELFARLGIGPLEPDRV